MLERFRALPAILDKNAFSISATTVPTTAGITLYQSDCRVFCRRKQHGYRLKNRHPRLNAPSALYRGFAMPGCTKKNLRVRVVSPGDAPQVELGPTRGGRVEVKLGPVFVFASVIIESAKD